MIEYLDFFDIDALKVFGGWALAVLLGLDKIVIVAIKTLENIKKQWNDSFPPKKQITINRDIPKVPALPPRRKEISKTLGA